MGKRNGVSLVKKPLVVNICQQGFDFPATTTCKKKEKRGRKKKKEEEKKKKTKEKGKEAHSQEKILIPFALKTCS